MYIILGISLLNFMICTLFIQVKKNILNQYIFLDDLVSNIFQIKKCLLALSHISACQIHDCVADRFCKGVCNPRTKSRDQ